MLRRPTALLTLMVLLGGAETARACSIVANSAETAEVILVGRVLDLDERSGVTLRGTEQARARIEVVGVRRGDRALVGKSVELLTPPGPGGNGNCAVGFAVGRTYVVQAYESGGRLLTAGETRLVPRAAEAYVEQRAETVVRPAIRAVPRVAKAESDPTWALWLVGALGALTVATLGLRHGHARGSRRA